jgi:hypothetical protein
MMRTAKSTGLVAMVLGIGLCIAEPALARFQSTAPILHANGGGRLHAGAGVRHRRWHNFGPSIIQPGLDGGIYQPYYPHEFRGENYGHYPLAPFDYPNIVPQYSR